MVKDGEDWHGLQMTNLKMRANLDIAPLRTEIFPGMREQTVLTQRHNVQALIIVCMPNASCCYISNNFNRHPWLSFNMRRGISDDYTDYREFKKLLTAIRTTSIKLIANR